MKNLFQFGGGSISKTDGKIFGLPKQSIDRVRIFAFECNSIIEARYLRGVYILLLSKND